MFNPTYLQRSRHGIFYFRWSIPAEAKSKSTSLRLSLRTRESRQALRLAMPLSYLARTVTLQGLQSSMDHKQLRIVLREHFDRFLDQRKAKIDADGPLSSSEQELLRNTAAVVELQLKDGPIDAIESEAETAAFSKLYGLGIEPRTEKFEVLRRSFLQAHRDFVSNGVGKGPRIGAQKGPLCRMVDAPGAPERAAVGGAVMSPWRAAADGGVRGGS